MFNEYRGFNLSVSGRLIPVSSPNSRSAASSRVSPSSTLPAGNSITGCINTQNFTIQEPDEFIIIDHGGGYRTVYKNINNVQVDVGDYIISGEKIAEVAKNTSNDYILHFGVWKDDKKLNPEEWLIKKCPGNDKPNCPIIDELANCDHFEILL